MIFWKTASTRSKGKVGKELYAEDLHDLWIEKGVDRKLREIYSKRIEDIFAWDYIKRGVQREGEIYFDNCMYLNPSGKYWTFWACGNMRMKEMVWDTIFWEEFDRILVSKGLYYNCGEGDLTDIFVGAINRAEHEGLKVLTELDLDYLIFERGQEEVLEIISSLISDMAEDIEGSEKIMIRFALM